MLSRKIFAPAAIIACKTSADSVAGPRVQMILVFRIREQSDNGLRMRVETGEAPRRRRKRNRRGRGERRGSQRGNSCANLSIFSASQFEKALSWVARGGSACVWSACDLSPLWFVAERRWGGRLDPQFAYPHRKKLDQRGSTATQSGDKSRALHNAGAIGHVSPVGMCPR